MLAGRLAILAILTAVAGCKPSTFGECKEDASKRPTDKGVSVALSECHRIYVEEPAAKELAQQRAERAVKLKTWAETWGIVEPDAMSQKLALPLHSKSENTVCVDQAGKPYNCSVYRWALGDGTYLQQAVNPVTNEVLAKYLEPIREDASFTWTFIKH